MQTHAFKQAVPQSLLPRSLWAGIPYSFGKHVSFVYIASLFDARDASATPGIIPDTKGIIFAALWYRSPSSFLSPCATSLRADEVLCLFPRARLGPLSSSSEDKFCWTPCEQSPRLFPRARIRPRLLPRARTSACTTLCGWSFPTSSGEDQACLFLS